MRVSTSFDLETLHYLQSLPVDEEFYHMEATAGWGRAVTFNDSLINKLPVYMYVHKRHTVYYRCEEGMIAFEGFIYGNGELRRVLYEWLDKIYQANRSFRGACDD